MQFIKVGRALRAQALSAELYAAEKRESEYLTRIAEQELALDAAAEEFSRLVATVNDMLAHHQVPKKVSSHNCSFLASEGP
jgi:ABC-type transporter Mla subunit MlaD